MPSFRAFAFTALLACLSPLALAQDAPPAIEKQMTPAEFKGAGLDKLTPDELARLNTWLGRTITTETTKAAAESKKKVEDDNRGFFNFGSQTPVVGHIQGHFEGFEMGRSYVLQGGQVWRQIDDATLAGVRLDNPAVIITPGRIGNVWYMQVGGYNTHAKVQRVK